MNSFFNYKVKKLFGGLSNPLIKLEFWSGVGGFHTKLSMIFGEFSMHAWSRCERRTFYIGSLERKLILAPQRHAKMSLASMNPRIQYFLQTSTHVPSMHQKLTEHGKFCMPNKTPNRKLQLNQRISLLYKYT